MPVVSGGGSAVARLDGLRADACELVLSRGHCGSVMWPAAASLVVFLHQAFLFDDVQGVWQEGDDMTLGCVKASPLLAFFWLCCTTAFFLILRERVVCDDTTAGQDRVKGRFPGYTSSDSLMIDSEELSRGRYGKVTLTDRRMDWTAAPHGALKEERSQRSG